MQAYYVKCRQGRERQRQRINKWESQLTKMVGRRIEKKCQCQNFSGEISRRSRTTGDGNERNGNDDD